MGSKPPKIYTVRNIDDPNDTNSSVQFSVGDTKAMVEFAKFGKDTASVIRNINVGIQAVVNVIKSIIGITAGVRNFVQGLIDIGKNIVEDALALGGHAIIVHPWNQRNKEYKSIIYNGTKNILDVPPNAGETTYLGTRVSNWFNDIVDTTTASETNPEVLNLGIPQLTVQGAINEVIWACDNLKDPLRPKFTERMWTTGIGIILNVTNPLDLTQLIDALKVIFDFSAFDEISQRLEERFEKFEEQMASLDDDFVSSLKIKDPKNRERYKKEWETLGITKQMEIIQASDNKQDATKSSAKVNKNFKQSNTDKLSNINIDEILEQMSTILLTGESGPRWFGLRLDMIPLLKEIKEVIDISLDGLGNLVSFVSDSIIDTLTIIMKKIQQIMAALEQIAQLLESIDKLRASFLAGGAWFFVIEPEIGGIPHLKEDLQALIPLIPNSNVAGYSVMIFLTAGYPDYSSSSAYVKRFQEILGDFNESMVDLFGLNLRLEPTPSTSYALTTNAQTITFEVKSSQDYDFSYTYNYRTYLKDNPFSGLEFHQSTKKTSNKIINIPARPGYVYELEVKGELVNPTEFEERNFDIIYHEFVVLRNIDLTVDSENAIVDVVEGVYTLYVPTTVRIYNFKKTTTIKYNNNTDSFTTDITEYTVKTDEDNIDYVDVKMDAEYLITFTNTRPDAITDTIQAIQDELNDTDKFTINSATLKDLIKEADSTTGPNIISTTDPEPPEDVSVTVSFPPDPETTTTLCVIDLIQKYLYKNKRCEFIFPINNKQSIVLYDCQDSMNSIEFHMVYNTGKYDPDKSDASSYRIPTEDYYLATATPNSPVAIELNNFSLGYYVIRLQIYWKPGSIGYQKAGGTIPQLFDIYVNVIQGDTACFLVEE